jgi:pimeloyl-ACP methyl ester carboxylesterase
MLHRSVSHIAARPEADNSFTPQDIMILFQRRRSSSVDKILVAGVATLGALAVANYVVARRTDRRHPPKGAFLNVDGVKLHYSDRGEGSPIVLIHGNMVAGDDYDASGVAGILLKNHRVIIFDRPGFGHSKRPHDRIWTANRQADLLHKALQQLGVVRPVLVGHSWGAIVALAMAVRYEVDTGGVVALSGYYFWTFRPDVLLVGVGALPIIGDVLRYTVAPLLNWLTMPLVKRSLFSPGQVPERFDANFSTAMAIRPSQIRATSEDGALMIPGVLELRDHYKDLTLPVIIVAGDGDKVVFKRRAEQLKVAINGSVLHVITGVGHMVHYQATIQVAEAVEAVVAQSALHGASKAA